MITEEINILRKKFGDDGFLLTYIDSFGEEIDNDFDNDELIDYSEDSDNGHELDFENHIENLNYSDELFFVPEEDLKYLNIFNKIKAEEDDEKLLAMAHNLLDPNASAVPNFLTHAVADAIYQNHYPQHQMKVNNIEYFIPEIDFSNGLNAWYPDMDNIETEYCEICADIEDSGEDLNIESNELEIKAINKLKKKYPEDELFFLFQHDLFYTISDENQLSLLKENYINKFPDSVFAQALYLYEELSQLLLDPDNEPILLGQQICDIYQSVPFSITATNKFRSSIAINTKPCMMEVISFLFIQGIYHFAQNKIDEVEACLKQMAVLRQKENNYFTILRTCLSVLKLTVTAIESETAKN